MSSPSCQDLLSCDDGACSDGINSVPCLLAYEVRRRPRRRAALLPSATRRIVRRSVRLMGKHKPSQRQSSRGATPTGSLVQQGPSHMDTEATSRQEVPAAEPLLQESMEMQPPGSLQHATAAVPSMSELTAQLQCVLARVAALEEENASLRRSQSSHQTPLNETNHSAPSIEEPQHLAPLRDTPVQPVSTIINQEICQQPRPQHPTQNLHDMPPVSFRPPDHHMQPALYGRDEIPVFYGETPASQALQRNREVESWIATIEMLTRPATDDAFIRMARGRARGYAQMVLLGPVFKEITIWHEFKAKIRTKFRGTCTPERFFDMLAQSRMTPGQSPLDYYQAIEMAVLQGSRDYPYEIGDVEGLLRRTFTAGLPTWLRRQLLLLDFTSACRMAEKCQAIWDATVGVKAVLPNFNGAPRKDQFAKQQHNRPRPYEMPMPLGYPPVAEPLAEGATPALEYYSDGPLQAAAIQGTQGSSLPQSQSQPQQWTRPSKQHVHWSPKLQDTRRHSHQTLSPRRNTSHRRAWCEYHRLEGHNTSECRANKRLCYGCGEPGHFLASCPFRTSRPGQNSQPSGGSSSPREVTNQESYADIEGTTTGHLASQR